MILPLLVCLSVCLSVCLLALLLRKLWTTLTITVKKHTCSEQHIKEREHTITNVHEVLVGVHHLTKTQSIRFYVDLGRVGFGIFFKFHAVS